MKKQRNARYCLSKSYEEYPCTDTRHYGVWSHGRDQKLKVRVDPKRFEKSTYRKLTPEQLSVIHKRKSHYFHPPKPQYISYHCNVFCTAIEDMKKKWEEHYKPLINMAVERIPKPQKLTPGDCDLMMCGVLEPDEAQICANHYTVVNELEYQNECYEVIVSLYAQFLHLFASHVEQVTVKILTEENAMKDHFDRNTLYGTAAGKSKRVDQLPSFSYYDKLYCIWNFIKHNTLSTYEKLKEKHPEVLCEEPYQQGFSAIHYLKLSDNLVLELMDGCSAFFKEYCQLVFEENYEEAQWNYGQYFLDKTNDTIDVITNPLGIPSFL